jgi:hypothetical protein
MIDNGYKEEGRTMHRFWLKRIKDETGVSRTGRVLEGVLTQAGKVLVEWRPPHSTMGIYNDFGEFMLIHVDSHPSCNEVVWIDHPYLCPYIKDAEGKCNCTDRLIGNDD